MWEPFATTVDASELRQRALHYARIAGASADTLDGLDAFLADPTTQAILALPEERLTAYLLNDAYKPRMHLLYATYFRAVQTDFELSLRRTPMPLARIRAEDPELWRAFEARCAAALGVPPYPPAAAAALHTHFPGFTCSEEMLRRGEAQGVAPISWQELGGDLVAFSHGPIEASSHVETTLTQLVQELTIEAQVRALERRLGLRLGPTERLANSLGKLAAGVQRLADGLAQAAAECGGPSPATMLFAGRRSSSRRYLLLQNWYCMNRLPGYLGTSSVLAVTLLDGLLRQQQAAGQPQARADPRLRLAGTLAHEVMMVTDQLLGGCDDLDGSPAQIGALLAHLLLLAAAGGLAAPTALCDTFGTRGFVAAALAARLPQEFRDDAAARYPAEWAVLPAAARAPGASVFDLFSVWRMDSGDYEEMATYVADAWERRWAGTAPEARPSPPRFMHSNLESWDEMVALARLPPRIRPAVFAFGTLADGFLPFDVPAGQQAAADGQPAAPEIQLASVVMKAVQSSRPGLACSTNSAGKLGDDASAAKMQFDRRLPPDVVERSRQRLLALAREGQVDSEAASEALARAYHAATRERVLC